MKQERSSWWKRIKARVLIFGILMSILPLTIFGLASFNAARFYLQNNIQEQNYERAQVLSGRIEDFMTTMADSLIHVASTNAYALVSSESSTRDVTLGTLLREVPYFESIEVADSDYRVLGQISRREVDFPEEAGKKLNNLQINSEQTFSLSGVFFSSDNRPQVYLTVSIQDPQTRQNIGYLQAKTDLKSLVTQFTNLQIGKAGYVYLTDEKGNLIGHTDFSRVLVQENVKDNLAVQRFLTGNPSNHQESEYQNPEGVQVIGTYDRVETLDWGVFIEQPVSEAYIPVRQFAVQVFGIILLGILIVTLISIYFGLKLTRPIEHLEEGVSRVGSTENLLTEIPRESNDEIGNLVTAFNRMLRQLYEKNQTLLEDQELFKTVVNGIGAGMVLLNEDKQIQWWNSIFADWFSTEDLNGVSCDTIMQGEGKNCLFLENGKVIPLDVGGERRYIRHMYYGLNPGNSEKAAYLLILEDVTQQVEMEARVIETEKMVAVGFLASGVAHEINNPLAIVSAHSEDLLDRMQEYDDPPGEQEIQRILKIISEQIERCKKITGRLLHFARQGQGGNDVMNAGIAILQTVDLLAYRAKQKKLTFKNQIDPGLWVVGNENEWQQVLLNILTNAMDASGEGKTIEIHAFREGHQVKVVVRDYGEGISKENLSRVFNPFFTTKGAGQGTGLGLFVSYGMVQRMQGHMSIESEEGKGTTVFIMLPHKGGVER
ncbi:PAS domain-containing sensor histidine kinase [Desulfitobacterium metallireducens]|uniref:histidine kinase n=1 Tax=Desulfitobacterium metallireducens DSM 15288 TaxID=871968 RepID=W0EAF2_9FIRM|nr:PAS domain-containing sensor histidine kinase [Desulfitobacterium metallireducens]AHF07727.1 histidine kinase [Desulfitobacterium metallireducens DSM 15288]